MFKATLLEQRESLSERLASDLRRRILEGDYSPGHALPPEHVIASGFGVSRTVAREAVARLKAEGLIEGRQGVGIFVAAELPSPVFRLEASVFDNFADLVQIAELRRAYEGEAARMAALRRTAEDLQEMRASLSDLQVAVSSSDFDLGVQSDVRFHRAISRSTYNPYFLKLFESLRDTIGRGISIARQNSSHHVKFRWLSFEEHRTILDAIESADPIAARHAAETHIENTLARLEMTAGKSAQ